MLDTDGEEGTRLLAEAVTAYRAALTVYTQEQLLQDWAMPQNNLGVTLGNQGTRTGDEEGKELIRQAIHAYELALQNLRAATFQFLAIPGLPIRRRFPPGN